MSIIEWRVIPWWPRACSCSPGSIVAFPPAACRPVRRRSDACLPPSPHSSSMCPSGGRWGDNGNGNGDGIGAMHIPMHPRSIQVRCQPNPWSPPAVRPALLASCCCSPGRPAPPEVSRTNHRYPYPPPSLFISLFSYWHAVRPGKFHVIFLCSGKLFTLETKIDIYFNLLPQLASIFGSLDAVSSLLICLNVGPFQVCLFQFQPSSICLFLFGRPDLTCKDWTFSE
jgi:hypothetical protein